jgi:hypothetical protein
VTAAVDLAAKKIPRTVELAPAVMRDYVQRPAVLGLGWWQVAAAAEMTGSEAASAMAEAVAVMVAAAVAAAVVRRSLLDGVLAESAPYLRIRSVLVPRRVGRAWRKKNLITLRSGSAHTSVRFCPTWNVPYRQNQENYFLPDSQATFLHPAAGRGRR